MTAGAPWRVAIRADGAPWLGLGHLARCVALAEEIQRAKGQVVIYTRPWRAEVVAWVKAQGVSVVTLPALSDPRPKERACDWLGVSERDDVAAMVSAVKATQGPVDWVVADHYGLGATWDMGWQSREVRVLALDDLASRRREVDLLVDVNRSPEPNVYAGLVPDSAQVLLGPRYALLRQAVVKARQHPKDVTADRRLVVMMGGADADNVTQAVLKAWEALKRDEAWLVDVLVGAANPHTDQLEATWKAHPRIRLWTPQEQTPDALAQVMRRGWLCVGAAGGSSWERAALGLPTLMVTTADNQRPVAHLCQTAGVARWLNPVGEDLTASLFEQALRWAWDSPESLSAMAGAGTQLVDGMGVCRVVAAMMRGSGLA